MEAILANPDAAIESGWTPKQWELAGGFDRLVRRRIHNVIELRFVLAGLGATGMIGTIRHFDAQEPVDVG